VDVLLGIEKVIVEIIEVQDRPQDSDYAIVVPDRHADDDDRPARSMA
jgi:hypothetical protein